ESAVAGHDLAGILHTHRSLEEALREIADLSDRGADGRDHGELDRINLGRAIRVMLDEGARGRGQHAAERALPGLLRAHRLVELVLSEPTPCEVGAGVAGPGEDAGEQHPCATVRKKAQTSACEEAARPPQAREREAGAIRHGLNVADAKEED